MKFTINRDLLLSELNHVSKGLSTKTPMPILTGIKIAVEMDGLTLTTSNTEISIQVKIPKSQYLTIEEVGECVVPGKYFLEIIRKIDARDVDFAIFEENMIKILADRSNFTLIGLDKDDYPLINFNDSSENVVLDGNTLKQIIKQTSFATGVSETRIILTGISFVINENRLTATATDSFRLAKKTIKLPKNYEKISVVVPSKALDDLNKIIDDADEKVYVHLMNNKVLFKYKNISFLTRLIEGTYPDTSSLIPKEFFTDLKFNKQELISAIDRAALFTVLDAANIVKLTLKSDKVVEIASNSNEIGKVVEEVYPTECSVLKPFQIAFSSKYFLDAIKSFDSNEITIHFTGEIKPFVVSGEYDPNLTQLILPVRVS
ncbi:MAG TPA: DNA polymerase III subunit beta [Bacilli bacterium]|nr:DNA polymerase III subunit beta [Bacilli bacterium]